MPNRSGKKQDINERAFSIVQHLTGEARRPDENEGKNPNAVALGRLGGIKGGRARADSLSGEERSDLARKAAKARWARKPQ